MLFLGSSRVPVFNAGRGRTKRQEAVAQGKILQSALDGNAVAESILIVFLSLQRSKPQRLLKGTERILHRQAERFKLQPSSLQAPRIGSCGNLAIHIGNKFFAPVQKAILENPLRFIDVSPDPSDPLGRRTSTSRSLPVIPITMF